MTAPRPTTSTSPLTVLQSLSAVRRNLALYPAGHAVIEQTADELQRVVERAIDEYGRVRIEVIGGTAHVDGYPFRLESQANGDLLDEFQRMGIQCLQIDADVDREELLGAARLLNELRERRGIDYSIRRELTDRGIMHVTMSKLLPVQMQRGRTSPATLPLESRDAVYAAALESAQSSIGPVFEGATPEAESVRAVLEHVGEQIIDRRSALSEILAVKRYENHTYCHSVNVASLSVLLGRRLGLDTVALEMVAEAALLHDVGKRSIPREILNKAGPLNRREWRIMHRHPALGAEILVASPGISPVSATVALEHHRSVSGGGGYPDLGGSKPHPISQIVAVADTYEALTGTRAYRAPLIPDEACMILAGMAGEKLNADLVRAFVSLVTFFPLGSVVRTSLGEYGVVVDTQEREPLHPTIFTIEHPESQATPGLRIDTAVRDEAGEYARHIVAALPETAPHLPDAAWETDPGSRATTDRRARRTESRGRRPRRGERRPVGN